MKQQQDRAGQDGPEAAKSKKEPGAAVLGYGAGSATMDNSGGRSKVASSQLLRAAFLRAPRAFGQPVSIFIQLPEDRHVPLSDMEWPVTSSVALEQFLPVQLDRTCGERVCIGDIIGPAQHAAGLVENLKGGCCSRGARRM